MQQLLLGALELVTLEVVVAAVDPLRVNLPVAANEVVGNRLLRERVLLDAVADLNPRVTVLVGQR
jgi:hypothetical protein